MTVDVPEDYKVSFGKIARTLVYEDAVGRLIFTFDVSPVKEQSEKKSNLSLDNGALIEVNGKHLKYNGNAEPERKRIEVATERVRQYVIGCGYILHVS